jgi:phosphatidylglycerophosphate synthase
MSLPVVLYVPNVLGYLRIVLAFVGLYFAVVNQPVFAVVSWILSSIMDLFDGIAARVLQQTSSFGVFLDIAADNLLRTTVWLAVAMVSFQYEQKQQFLHHYSHEPSLTLRSVAVPMLSCCIICMEWITMVSTQVYAASNGVHWKNARSQDPWMIQFFFRNNFRNPLGFLGIYGLFAANLFMYGSYHPVLYGNIFCYDTFMYIAFAGRLLSLLIEIWFCCSYISFLLSNDRIERSRHVNGKFKHP